MAKTGLQLPKDTNSELYFDARTLAIGFRRKKPVSASLDLQKKVLRVVVQAFGRMVDDRLFPVGSQVTIGPARRNTFRLPSKGLCKRHRFLKYQENGSITVCTNQYFEGVLQLGDTLVPLDQAPSVTSGNLNTVVLPPHSRGCLQHGTIVFYFELVSPPEKLPPVPILKNFSDPYFSRWLVISLSAHLLLLMTFKLLPARPAVVQLEQLPKTFQKIIVQPKDYKPFTPKKFTLSSESRGPVGQEGEGERAPGKEGRRGRGIPGKRISGAELKKVQTTGVLPFFSKGSRGVLNELIGGESGLPGSIDSAFNRNARYGLPGERELRSGKGLQGTGTGGGGRTTSIGHGLGTKGPGGGRQGTGLADFGTGKSETTVSASIDSEEVMIMGNIPKEVIAKIIADNLGQIRYCYEKELVREPKLRGKVLTNFIIGLEGSVTSARMKQSTMQNANVENCILGVIRRLPFPKPGGGIVEVTYPFLFRVAG